PQRRRAGLFRFSRSVERQEAKPDMDVPRSSQRPPQTRGWLVLAALILPLSGCSENRVWERFVPFRHPDAPTVGTDMQSVPPGQPIPAAGLGVGLVGTDGSAKPSPNPSAPLPKVDPEVRTAGSP